MKRLQLKKVKISRITNPYALLGGVLPGNEPKTVTLNDACRHTKDDKDVDCNDQTNTNSNGRTNTPGSQQDPNNNPQV